MVTEAESTVSWQTNTTSQMPLDRSWGEFTHANNLVYPLADHAQDQWNQFATHGVSSHLYGRPISTVFADTQCYLYDEENDPAISSLRYIDYRYLRFFHHPLEDKFCLLNGWKDQTWENVRMMRGGLDADDRDSREQIFGPNIVDIKQKSVPQLLIDEVSALFLEPPSPMDWSSQINKAFHPFYIFQVASLVLWSLDEYYYYAVCIFLISAFSISATVIETKSVCIF